MTARPQFFPRTIKIDSQKAYGSPGEAVCRDIADCPKDIIGDGPISAEAALAKRLLEDKDCPRANKYFMGIPDDHCPVLGNVPPLATKIEEMLAAQ